MDVIAMARQLGKALQQDEGYLRLMVAQQQNDADEALQALIGKFNLARINLNTELNKTDKDQARVTALNEEVRAVYGQIMDNENMAAYNKAKTEFDDTVDFVMQILRGSINGEDPDLIEKQSGCSGSCSSCSGCS
ncbi:YlbF family regulator [Anaerotruncus colihominis]|uniref:YlbF family regulator n=1 Tax=Anaerotruncus colihominis TaxID=169435 RepID=UPI0018980C56|nr:YlbF family regulator [Anaerotruncus colihominis]